MTEIPKCPTCGRRPSERAHYNPLLHSLSRCPDPCHDAADLGPAAVALLREVRAKIRVHLNGYCFGDSLLHQIDSLLAAAPEVKP